MPISITAVADTDIPAAGLLLRSSEPGRYRVAGALDTPSAISGGTALEGQGFVAYAVTDEVFTLIAGESLVAGGQVMPGFEGKVIPFETDGYLIGRTLASAAAGDRVLVNVDLSEGTGSGGGGGGIGEVLRGTNDPPTAPPTITTGAAIYYHQTNMKQWNWNGSAWIKIIGALALLLAPALALFGQEALLRNQWTTNVTGLVKGAWTNMQYGLTVDAAPRISRYGPAFIEFVNSNAPSSTAWASVGMHGHPEANLAFNMNYRDAVHRFYDTNANAMWLALGSTAWALQAASNKITTGDIWYANGTNYLLWGSIDGRLLVGGNLPEIQATPPSARLTVPRRQSLGEPSISGWEDLVIDGHRIKGQNGIVYINSYSTGRTIINNGKGGVIFHGIADPGTNTVLFLGNVLVGTTNLVTELAKKQNAVVALSTELPQPWSPPDEVGIQRLPDSTKDKLLVELVPYLMTNWSRLFPAAPAP
jgi:hypothetical protein